MHELDDATIISELEAQGEEVMRQWSSLLNTAHMEEANSTNNNSINSTTGNNNNQAATESGCVLTFFAILHACVVVEMLNSVMHDASSEMINETLPRLNL